MLYFKLFFYYIRNVSVRKEIKKVNRLNIFKRFRFLFKLLSY